MPIEYDTRTLRTLFIDHESRKLALPNFQREFVWTLEDQKQLLASVLSSFPVGSVLLLKGTSDDFAARPLGRLSSTQPSDECIYLLDGQQRLTCFYHFFADPFGSAEDDWKTVVRDTYSLVRNRWMVRVLPGEDEENDPFGYRWLRFPGPASEPDDVKDLVKAVRVNLTNPTRDYANPAWYLDRLRHHGEDGSGVRATRLARLDLARRCREDGVVPLWDIFRSGTGPESRDYSPLHEQTLRLISQTRAEELSELVSDPPQEMLESAYAIQPELLGAGTQGSLEDSERLRSAIPAMQENWIVSISNHLAGLIQIPVPGVTLPSEEVDRSIPIFEVMNRGGTPLTTFDLVVAKMARASVGGSEPDLGLAQHLVEFGNEFKVRIDDAMWGDNSASRPGSWRIDNYNFMLDKSSLTSTFKNAFLNLLSIHVHFDNSSLDSLDVDHIRRKAILKVSSSDIDANWRSVAEALGMAWCFLSMRCGIRTSADLRNKLVVLPIAYVFLSDQNVDKQAIDRLEHWYWSSVLTGTYTERQNENAIADIRSLHDWMLGEVPVPFEARARRALNDDGYSDEATLLRLTEESAVTTDVGSYLAQYVLSRNPKDFLSGTRLAVWDVATELELHHIVPLWSATSVGESTSKLRRDRGSTVLNSPLNLTYISKSSNRTIGARPVSQYVSDLPQLNVGSHFWPVAQQALEKQSGEDDEEFYRRLLRIRFQTLSQDVHTHLDHLATT